MNSICALPDNNLKSVLIQEIFKDLLVANVMSWRKMSRFFRSECAHHVKKIPKDDLGLKLMPVETYKNNRVTVPCTYNSEGYITNQGYIFIDPDLSNLVFMCNYLRNCERLIIDFDEGYITEATVDANFMQVFPGFDNLERKVSVQKMFIKSYHCFMLKWFEPQLLIFTGVSEKEESFDWKKLPPLRKLEFHETADSLLCPAFFATPISPHTRCFLTAAEKLDWTGIVDIIKQWRADERDIELISFRIDVDSAENVEKFDVFEKTAALLQLIGPENVQAAAHDLHNPPSVIAASFIVQNHESTKKLAVRMLKRANFRVFLEMIPIVD